MNAKHYNVVAAVIRKDGKYFCVKRAAQNTVIQATNTSFRAERLSPAKRRRRL